MTGLPLFWSNGSAQVLEMGAMLSDLVFYLEDGRQVSPLHKAPWLGEELPASTPPLLAALQGEWPCVPFGAAAETPLKGRWADICVVPEPWPHGYGANHPWVLSQVSPEQVDATIIYPDDSPIASLRRSVSGRHAQNAIDITLEITARENVSLPLGLHPVFKLPEEPGAARLLIGDFNEIWVYPGDTGGDSIFSFSDPVTSFDELALRVCEGWDPLALPYPCASESILLLSDTHGSVTLENRAESYRCTLNWDANALPSLMLWISNNGRSAAPWNGRHRALGIEPVCAPFDFGSRTATVQTPLNMAGVPTSVRLTRHRPWRTTYRVAVESI